MKERNGKSRDLLLQKTESVQGLIRLERLEGVDQFFTKKGEGK